MGRTIILVHGTFAAPKPGVTQWYEGDPGHADSFAGRVAAALRAEHDTQRTTWRVFTWSGKNDHGERVQAAAALCERITHVLSTAPDEEVCLIAHSHGGNVALKALELLFRGGREASEAYDYLLETLGVERLNAEGAAARIVARYRIADPSLRTFLKSASQLLMLMARLHGLPPADASAEDVTRWIQRIRRAYLVRWTIESFSMRWNMERRPRLQLITMGTPFFQKSWLARNTGQMRVERIGRGLAIAAASAAALYCLAAAVTTLLSFVGVNVTLPISESGTAISLAVLLILGSAAWVRMVHQRDDANLYFALPGRSRAERSHERPTPWQLTTIHAGLLDEALLGLSVEPLVAAGLGPVLRRPLAPPLQWRLGQTPIGLIAPATPLIGDFARLARQAAMLCALWIYNMTVGIVLRTVAWLVALVAHRFLLNAATRLVSSVGMGVPESELRDARMHIVPVPALEGFFAQEAWDATQALIEEPAQPPSPAEQLAQWRFLSDPDALAAEIRESVVWPYLQPHGTEASESEAELRELQRVSVAIEQRLREALGLVPLNHSSYYGNPQVIARVAHAIKAWSHAAPPARDLETRPTAETTLPDGRPTASV